MKWDILLKVLPSSGKSDVKLIAKCCNRKTIKKMPDRAINTFLMIDEYIVFFSYSTTNLK